MSRCFPFPPPGFERQAEVFATNILKKDTSKDKGSEKDKKKKEKKENIEKKEGKEARDKVREKKKHREKKEHRAQEVIKQKDVNLQNIQGARSNGHEQACPVLQNGSTGHSKGPSATIVQNGGIYNAKYVEDLERRIKNEDKAVENCVAREISSMDQRTSGVQGNMWKVSVGQKVEVQAPALKNTDIQNHSWMGQVRPEGNFKSPGTANISVPSILRDATANQRVEVQAPALKNTTVQNHSFLGQGRPGGNFKPPGTANILVPSIRRDATVNQISNCISDKEIRKEKLKHNDVDEVKRKEDKARRKQERAKRREEKAGRKEEREKKREGKAKKKEEKARRKELKAHSKNKSSDTEKFNNLKEESKEGKNGLIQLPCPAREPSSSFVGDKGLGKRKFTEINGVIHEEGIQPRKVPRCIPPIPAVENGRKLEFSLPTIKKRNVHRVVDSLSSLPSSIDHPSSAVRGDENSRGSLVSPHPDAMYLEKLLVIPQVEEITDLDSGQWLYSAPGRSRTSISSSSQSVAAVEVWSEAVRIESADITVLPYVIPY